MDNYAYIIASMPVLNLEDDKADNLVAQELLDEIRGQLSARDTAVLDQLLDGYNPEKLDAEFYQKARQHRNRFIREWFSFDLNLRNATVAYLNDSLGRQEGLDLVKLEGRETEEFPEAVAVQQVLNCGDILARERGLDELRWKKIDELTLLDSLDLEVILGFVAKLKIIDRWLQLDPDSGRALFRRLVDDIRSTYDNKKQNLTI
ncbi:MAG: DUF2764 family protein [Bacteroidales bacterium]|jgi:hypothetical protein|nr:DUF2764 family protein [Bacteroidales bacterium]MDY6418163.1 DUF2764 family protein [Bacteroidales bacterium]MDY6444205.1 DUF2764 family protein [Bacteroidales bacterium]